MVACFLLDSPQYGIVHNVAHYAHSIAYAFLVKVVGGNPRGAKERRRGCRPRRG